MTFSSSGITPALEHPMNASFGEANAARNPRIMQGSIRRSF